MQQRLNKIIANSGLCSRRKADELINRREVTLNGKIVAGPGVCADPEKDIITINEKPLREEKKVYILLNKPSGYTTTTHDIHAEKKVTELLPARPERLYPVGRLDKDTTGLLILTNDGTLHYELTHPKFEVDRVYEVIIKNIITPETIKKIEQGGLTIEDYQTNPCKIQLISKTTAKTTLQLTIREGKKRQIRKMFFLCGHPVIALKRIQFGKLKLGALKPGEWRYLKKSEII